MKPQITIPEPCHENWAAMTDAEKGRHCAVCDKVVKDFTGMKNEEIVAVITSAEENVCGRFYVDQVKPSGILQMISMTWKRLVWGKMLLPAMSVLGLGVFSKAAVAQKTMGKVAVMGDTIISPVSIEKKIIRFVVSQPGNHQPVVGATISIYSGENLIATVSSDANGRANVEVDPGMLVMNTVDIKVYGRYSGYREYNDVRLDKREQTIRVTLEDEEKYMIMGIIAYVPVDTVENTELPPVDTTETVPADSNIVDTTVTCTKNPYSEMELFPNPTSGKVNIALSGSWENKTYFVEDMNARKIMMGNIVSERFSLDFGGYAPGIYLMVIFHKGVAVETKKIIVQ